MDMNVLKQHLGKWIAAFLLVLAGSQGAVAATATIEGFDSSEFVKTVQGTWAYNTKVSFDEPGAYKLTLTNFKFPNTLDAVGVMVSSATQNFVDIVSYDKAESLTKLFNVGQGSYFLSIFAISDRQLSLGSLGVSFQSAEVPLPPALILLMSGAMSLMAFVRRKQVK
jgi:hypothetical protein